MHNVEEDEIFRPAAWNALGMIRKVPDYRACATLAPFTNKICNNYAQKNTQSASSAVKALMVWGMAMRSFLGERQFSGCSLQPTSSGLTGTP